MSAPTRFDRFMVGDHISFERSFSEAEFEAFSKLSGDRNAFHHDKAYAGSQPGPGLPIVPLHMTLGPLSMIAGMDFPGEPSLYLGHEVRAAKPVLYGETLRYSARIAAINHTHNVLSVRVLAMRGVEIVLDAMMRIQARVDDWKGEPLHPIRRESEAVALITGASGEIGQAIAVALARRGWRLLLHDRGPSQRRDQVKEALALEKCEVDFVAADLTTPKGQAALASAVAVQESLGLVVHAASPPVEAPVEQHVAVAFSSLKAVADASLPNMLARQSGAFVLIGSSAVEAALPGWEAYTGTKAMATQFVGALDRANAPYGVTGHTLAPGLVATGFSEAFRSIEDSAMMPAEVAAHLVALLDDRATGAKDWMVDTRQVRRGRFGFGAPAAAAPIPVCESQPADRNAPSDTDDAQRLLPGGLADIVRNALGLPVASSLDDGGLGVTPGWDSLRHIELLLKIEEGLGIRFSSAEIERTHRFDELAELVRRKQETGA